MWDQPDFHPLQSHAPSYRTSVQLVFTWLSRLNFLKFNCNFGVVMGGREYSVHLLHHLDGNLIIVNNQHVEE